MNAIKKLHMKHFLHHLKPRPKDAHKGDFGKVLIIGGDLGYSGAVRLAGEAALRAGAGSVSIATRAEHSICLNASAPELMCHGISQPEDLRSRLDQATFIVLGPGLGTTEWGFSLLKETLAQNDKPILFDADALNLVAMHHLTVKRENGIFTPHPGEAARLLHTTPGNLQKDRLTALHRLYELLGGTVVLKGSETLIMAQHNDIEICQAGNPGMATAGMGDVLSGIIAGLAAQSIPLCDATKMGVLIHALAGDLSAQEQGERGMIASDLIGYIRKIIHQVSVTP